MEKTPWSSNWCNIQRIVLRKQTLEVRIQSLDVFFQFNTKDLVICRYSLFFLTTLLLEVDAIPKQVAQHEDVLTKIHSKRCKAVFSNQAPLVVDGGNKSQHDAIYVTRWQSWILSPGSWDWSVGTHMYIYIYGIYTCVAGSVHVHSPYIMFPTWLHQTCCFAMNGAWDGVFPRGNISIFTIKG